MTAYSIVVFLIFPGCKDLQVESMKALENKNN